MCITNKRSRKDSYLYANVGSETCHPKKKYSSKVHTEYLRNLLKYSGKKNCTLLLCTLTITVYKIAANPLLALTLNSACGPAGLMRETTCLTVVVGVGADRIGGLPSAIPPSPQPTNLLTLHSPSQHLGSSK